jgi:hypothetical protein
MESKASWTHSELTDELKSFEVALRKARLKENTIATYVDRTSIFLRWLIGDYQPRGPQQD